MRRITPSGSGDRSDNGTSSRRSTTKSFSDNGVIRKKKPRKKGSSRTATAAIIPPTTTTPTPAKEKKTPPLRFSKRLEWVAKCVALAMLVLWIGVTYYVMSNAHDGSPSTEGGLHFGLTPPRDGDNPNHDKGGEGIMMHGLRNMEHKLQAGVSILKQKIHKKSKYHVASSTSNSSTAEWSALSSKHYLLHSSSILVKSDTEYNMHATTDTNNKGNMIDMRELTATLPFEDVDGGAWKQGWDVQPVELNEKEPLQVFIVPHSHCDPGWLKTFDEYFQSQTKGILTSVYNALMKDDRRKFIWAEISYFQWWWSEQTPEVQRNVKERLLPNGQLEFVTGGWVQPDEANTERYAMEVQLQEGHDWIANHLGDQYIPKYAWSIDPFGYSPTMAHILKTYGFKAMLIQRVHYAVKKELALHKHLEFMWRQTWDKTGEHDIFTHLMPFYSYDVPHTCGPDPSVCCQFDFARVNNGYSGCPWRKPAQEITDSNVKARSMLILDQWRKKANLYRGNAVMIPLGDDFRYQSDGEAELQYSNFQKIFDYLNKNVPGVSVQFGTLGDYFKAVEGDFEPPVLKGSFFTYADREKDYWSGYFTSRVFDKALDRQLERVLFAATDMGATRTEMQSPRRALSLFQHHDGVTGTAKNHVVEDYAKQIHEGIEFVQSWMLKNISKDQLLRGAVDKSMKPCWQSNAPRGLSQNLCDVKKQIYVYNPLDSEQQCGDTVVPSHETVRASLPCDISPSEDNTDWIKFDAVTGMMTYPFKEEWMLWKVDKGGAYLFFPGTLKKFKGGNGHDDDGFELKNKGFTVSTPSWKRTLFVKPVPDEFRDSSSSKTFVIDMVYETNLRQPNEEWFVRFTTASPVIENKGIFHTDLNGFNFDTHHFRKDLPIQSQVFPMPTLASIEDSTHRFTILSEHAQGTASLQDGSIDVWLDRRLEQDDARGLGHGVKDNVPTRTRLRVVLESGSFAQDGNEFEPTPLCQRMWDELNHPLEMFGSHNEKQKGLAKES